MKFHLINPKLPLSFAGNEYAASMVFKKYSTPPLGLLTVAGMTPDRHQVTLCDENVSAIDFDVDCDVVGLTGMHLQGAGIRQIFQEQVDFINDAKIPLPLRAMLGALPATPLYDRMREEGRLIPEHEFQGNSCFANIIPKQLTMDELEQGYRSMVQDLYDPVTYTSRVLGELEHLNRTAGKASNYRLPVVLAGFLWVLAWYIVPFQWLA